MKAVRGAICAGENSANAIWDAAEELMREIVKQNKLKEENIVSVMFTMTKDLTKAFPSRAVRERLGLNVPLIDTEQKYVEGDMARCIRAVVFVEGKKAVKHVYMGKAANLRKDLGGSV